MSLQNCERIGLVIHAAHAARRHGRSLVLLGHIGDEHIGGEDHRGDGSGVLERAAHNLDRVNNASLDHVGVFASEHIEADVNVLLLGSGAADGVNDDRAILTSV